MTVQTERAEEKHIRRLYVAGSTPQSSRASKNVKAICETHLEGRAGVFTVSTAKFPRLLNEAAQIRTAVDELDLALSAT